MCYTLYMYMSLYVYNVLYNVVCSAAAGTKTDALKHWQIEASLSPSRLPGMLGERECSVVEPRNKLHDSTCTRHGLYTSHGNVPGHHEIVY